MRVWYIDKDAPAGRSIRRAIWDAAEAAEAADDPDDPIFRLTPFVDPIGEYASGPYEFDWEREWRVRGELRFTPDDVPFLFIPAEHHAGATRMFDQAVRENLGPGYFCPYIDMAGERLRRLRLQSGINVGRRRFAGGGSAPGRAGPCPRRREGRRLPPPANPAAFPLLSTARSREHL